MRRFSVAPRTRGVVAVIALALGLSLVPAGSAIADVRQFRYGVMEGQNLQPRSDIAGIARAEAEVLRVLFNWAAIEVQRGQRGHCNAVYDWSYTDDVVSEAGRNNVDLLPFIAGSPPYVGPSETSAPHTRSREIEDYKCFVRELANRYGRSGEYLAQDAAADPITQWQIWNEPNIRGWAPNRKVDPREYARLVKLSRGAIVSQDRRAEIVLAGMPEFYSPGMSAKKFLTGVYRVRGAERTFEAVALHPYARNSRGVQGAVMRMRDLLRDLGDRRRSLWVTEVGWATNGPNKKYFVVKSPKGQAAELTKTFKMLRKSHRRFKVGTVNWFRWRDAEAGSPRGKSHWDFAGLYDFDGTPKRSCHSFIRFTGGRCAPLDQGATTAARSSASSVLQVPGRERNARPSPPEPGS